MNGPCRTGADIADVERVAGLVRNERAEHRVYTEAERALCHSAARPEEEFARLWALKEAVLKALGVGWSGGVSWVDVGVSRAGRVYSVTLSGAAKRIADELGVTGWSVCADSTRKLATGFAMALLERNET